MWTYLFQVKYWNEDCARQEIAYHSIRAESFVEAVKIIESFYGDELEKIEVTCIEDVFGVVSKETYERLLMDLPFEEDIAKFNIEESEE